MNNSAWFKYGFACAAVAIAVGLRLLLKPVIGLDAPFLTFFLAVMAASVYGGFWPGLVAAICSTVAADYFFIEPLADVGPTLNNLVALGVFVTEVIGISLLSEGLHRAKRRAQKEQQNTTRILTSINDAFMALDANWTYRLVNERAALIMGKRTEELIGKRVWDLFPELVGTQIWSEMQQAMASRVSRTFEVFDDRTRRWYENRLYPYDDGLSMFVADVTERREAEEQLLRMNHSLQLAQGQLEEAGRRMEGHLTNTPLGVIEWDPEFRVTRWAGEAQRIFGWTADEMLGRQLGSFRWVHEDDVAHVESVSAQLRTQPRVVSLNRNYDKWGQVRYCEWYSSTVMKDGRMESVLSLVLDVTERHRADQAFKSLILGTASAVGEAFFPVLVRELSRALEMKYAMLTEFVADGTHRLRTRAVWMGTEWGSHAEYDVADTPCEVVLREGTAVYRTGVREAFPFDLRLPAMGADSYVGKALHDSTGRVIGHLCVLDGAALPPQTATLSILSVFASRAAAELERLRAQSAVRESQERLQIATDIAGLSPFEWDPRTGNMIFDAHLKRLWGLSPDAAVDQNVFLAGIHPEDRDAVEASLARAIDPQGEGWFAGEFRVLNRHDQAERWMSARGRTWFDEESPVGFIGAAVDVTARKHGEEQLKWWNAALERRVGERTKDLLESQTRLRSLATELTVAEQRERDRLARDLHDYLAQLLVLGRLKLGQAKSWEVPAAPKQLMAQTEEVLQEALTYTRTLVADLSPPILREGGLFAALRWLGEHMERFDLAVDLSLPDRPVELPTEQVVLMFQSVRELLMNVVKHANTERARLCMECEGRTVRFIVQDEGCGFDPTGIHVPVSKGFGLFSMRERLQVLGGQLMIDSSPGRGTTATLTLPLAASAEPESPFGVVTRAPGGLMTQQDAPIRVLLVDDHAMFRQGLRSVVESYPRLEVVGEAGNGKEALDVAAKVRPDVVVMDINMPLMDGIEATRRLKATHPEITVIGLSLHLSSEMERRMREAGASSYLTKESAIEQLYSVITAAIGDQEAAHS